MKNQGDRSTKSLLVTDWESEAVGLTVRSNRTESESFMRRKLALNEEKLVLNETQVFDDLMNIDA